MWTVISIELPRAGQVPPVPGSRHLAALGISADLAVHYVRAGWLVRLARGVFNRPNDTLALHPSLVLLQRRIEGPAQLPTGSDRRWVSRSGDGLLVLKP